MVILDNCVDCFSYIFVDGFEYEIKKNQDNVKVNWQGIGGIDENNNVLGVYVKQGQLYLMCNNKEYCLENMPFECNNIKGSPNYEFSIILEGKKIYSIEYKPYVSPLSLAFDEDDEEFDMYQCVYEILSSKERIEGFMRGMNSLLQD